MIKITVNAKVYAALSLAFPKPTNSAHRALAKYITVLEAMLFKSLHFVATPLQRKLDLFAISLQQLANQGGQIGPKKLRVHAWLRDNNLNLVEPVILGTSQSKEVSQCRLTSLVTMVDTLAVEDKILTSIRSDRELDQYLSGDEFSAFELVNLLYPEFKRRASAAELDQLFDLVPVDMASVKSYVYWLAMEANLLSIQKKNQALRQARIILAIASVMDGNYLQRRKPSPFGRLYYEGTSVQNINKELRRAVLGNCWEYDIRSSVVAWKMGWAKQYIDARGQGEDLRRVFHATPVAAADQRLVLQRRIVALLDRGIKSVAIDVRERQRKEVGMAHQPDGAAAQAIRRLVVLDGHQAIAAEHRSYVQARLTLAVSQKLSYCREHRLLAAEPELLNFF